MHTGTYSCCSRPRRLFCHHTMLSHTLLANISAQTTTDLHQYHHWQREVCLLHLRERGRGCAFTRGAYKNTYYVVHIRMQPHNHRHAFAVQIQSYHRPRSENSMCTLLLDDSMPPCSCAHLSVTSVSDSNPGACAHCKSALHSPNTCALALSRRATFRHAPCFPTHFSLQRHTCAFQLLEQLLLQHMGVQSVSQAVCCCPKEVTIDTHHACPCMQNTKCDAGMKAATT
jgi:hypothetical protein